MADGESGAGRPVSAYSTGGGGFTFEHMAAVRYLSAMLSGAARPELGEHRVVQVVFQHSEAASFDDLHILAARDDEENPSLELWIAVRRHPKFIPSDPGSRQLVGALAEAIGQPEVPGREQRLVVCDAGRGNQPREVGELAELARSKTSEDAFLAEVSETGRAPKRLRDRLGYLEELVRDSAPNNEEISLWRLLRQLYISTARLEPPDGTDWAYLLDELEGWANGQTRAGAVALRSRLAELAGEYGPAGAEVDRAKLRRAAHSQIHSDRRLLATAWEKLRHLELEARTAVRRGCGADTPVVLPRNNARGDLADAIETESVLVVTGESGIGKSALVCSALENLAESGTGEFESVYLSLRDLPERPSELHASLGAPLGRVLSEMSAPTRVLVVDAADRAAERAATPLAALLRAASNAGVAVCVVTAEAGRDTVEGIVADAGLGGMRSLELPGLGDGEIADLAGAFPSLRRIADDRRAREMLRRPVIADLLTRAGVESVPLSTSEAMEVIWSRLVRRDGRPGRGFPDSREQVMRQLAHWHLNIEGSDQAYTALDGETLDGLRHDGILRTSSRLWSPMPEFAHDILRVFAVAKVLGFGGSPAEVLVDLGAPRWTLPAAHLAFQALLAHREETGATLESIQESCETLVVSGRGARWGDVPVEAALGLPDWGDIVAESWDWLASDNGEGLLRVFRLVAHRHTKNGIADPAVAGPVASLLVKRWWPESVQSQAEAFLRTWLRGLVSQRAPAGNEARTRLRELVEHRVALGDQREQLQAEEQAARLAARSPEQVEEDEARIRISELHALLEPRHQRGGSLPFELTMEPMLELLVLLGPDLSAKGEQLLRRVAANDPERLQAAVESFLAGESLSQYNHGLLAHLVEAYYIDEDQLQFASNAFESGVRRHVYAGLGVAQAGPWRGPFFALFRRGFSAGVASLNRILNHAARVQMRPRSRSMLDPLPPSGADPPGEVLHISGEPRRYVGNSATWLWYRDIADGPYPCTSALQALERVCDQLLEGNQLPPDELFALLLDGCENLAMPALAYGLMVRHIERVERLIDPYLIEPFVWQAETQRVVIETSGLGGPTADAAAAERRQWTPLMAVMNLVLSALEDQDRQQELKGLGSELFERSAGHYEGTPRQAEESAIARKRALAFDVDQYEIEPTESGQAVRISLKEDEEVQEVLAESNTDLLRGMEADRLKFVYADRLIGRPTPEPLNIEQLARDINTAKAMLADPPQSSVFEIAAAPAAVAAAVLEGFFLDDMDLAEDDLVWAARTLADIVLSHKLQGEVGGPFSDTTVFPWGADRSAARSLPLLLRPDARPVLDRIAADGLDKQKLDQIQKWLFTTSPNETRTAASRALDTVWHSPCETTGDCFHQVALALIEQSARHTTPFRRQPGETYDPIPLTGPILDALASADNLVVSWLNPALRALGAEACSPAPCVHDQAAELLHAALKAHRRARCAFDIGSNHSSWDALFAARAVLSLAAAGHPTALQDHIQGFAAHFDGLRECLMALAAAAEETPEAAAVAHEAWPQIIRDGLRLLAENAESDLARSGRDERSLVFSALLPAPATIEMYNYREIPDGPIPWIDPEGWAPEIDMWVQAAIRNRSPNDGTASAQQDAPSPSLPAGGLFGSIGTMVSMLLALPTEDQARIGISWIEQLVAYAGSEAANTFTLPAWLQEVRPHCRGDESDTWQRITDHLYVFGDARVSDLAD